MKIARLLIYEGTADRLQEQLGNSLADGKKKFGKITLSTITIGITEGLNRFVEAQDDEIEIIAEKLLSKISGETIELLKELAPILEKYHTNLINKGIEIEQGAADSLKGGYE